MILTSNCNVWIRLFRWLTALYRVQKESVQIFLLKWFQNKLFSYLDRKNYFFIRGPIISKFTRSLLLATFFLLQKIF